MFLVSSFFFIQAAFVPVAPAGGRAVSMAVAKSLSIPFLVNSLCFFFASVKDCMLLGEGAWDARLNSRFNVWWWWGEGELPTLILRAVC